MTIKHFTTRFYLRCRKLYTLSITETSTSSSRASSTRTRRQTSSRGVLVLVVAEDQTGEIIPKSQLAASIRDKKQRIESIIGGTAQKRAEYSQHYNSIRKRNILR